MFSDDEKLKELGYFIVMAILYASLLFIVIILWT